MLNNADCMQYFLLDFCASLLRRLLDEFIVALDRQTETQELVVDFFNRLEQFVGDLDGWRSFSAVEVKPITLSIPFL